MNRCRMIPYEGNEPYIFISYAHKDSDRIFPILDTLADAGYRIWYDEGIAPGSEWPEYIAAHLNGSEVVIAFISANSIESPNCRREITFALSKKKNFIGIMLEETEMSPGMEMQLSAQQCIMKYNYTNDDAFYNKLYKTPDLINCKKEIPVQPEIQPVEQIKPVEQVKPVESVISTETLNSVVYTESVTPIKSPVKNAISDEDMYAVKHMENIVSTSTTNTPVKKPEKKPKSNKTRNIIIAAVGGSLLCIITLIFLFTSASGCVKLLTSNSSNWVGLDKNSPLASTQKGAYSLTVSDATISQEEISLIGQMPNVYTICFTNCTITGDLSKLSNCSQIRYVKLYDCSVSDYAFLSHMINAQGITITNGTFKNSDIDYISALGNLSDLDLTGNKEVTQLDNLNNTNIQTLILDGTGISNIDSICEYTSLKTLSASYTNVSEISKPFMSLRLETLRLEGLNNLCDISSFENLTQLKCLNIAYTSVTDFTWIGQNTDTLKELNISGLSPSQETMDAISLCINLQVLSMNNVQADNLDIIHNMSSLNKIYASNCGLNDISVLSRFTTLTHVWLDNNNIETISINKSKSLSELNVAHNNISDFSEISSDNNIYLSIYSNPADINSISNIGSYSKIIIDYSDDLLKYDCSSTYYQYYVANVPTNKQVSMEDKYSYRLTIATTAEIDKWISESNSVIPNNWDIE